MRTPTFVGSSSVIGEGTAINVPAPSGVLAGDFQLIVIANALDASTEIDTVPSGWTEMADFSNAGGGNSFRTWLFVSTTATTTAGFTQTGTGRGFHAARFAWRGHDNGNGGGYSVVATGSGTSHAISTTNVATANSLVIAGVHTDATASMTFTAPAGWTERYDAVGSIDNEALTVAEFEASSTGNVDGTFTSSASDHANTFAFILTPTPAPVCIGTNFVDIASNSFNLPAPSGVQAGDLQVAIIGVGTASETVTTPSGWTLATSHANNDSDSFSTWVYTSTTVTGAQTFNKSGTRGGLAVRLAYRDTSGPQASSWVITETVGTSHAISQRTVSANDSVVVAAVHTDGIAGMTFTEPPGWAERFARTDSGESQAMIVADRWADTGTVDGTFTSSTTDEANVLAVVLSPSSGTKNIAVGRVTETDTPLAITARKNPQRIAVGQAVETDQSRTITGNIVRYIAVGQAVETDTAPSVGQPTSVRVRLSTVWLNDLGVLTDYVAFENLAAMTVNKTVTGDVRRLAGGRRRLVRRKGKAYTHTLTLDHCDAAQRAWLDAHVGQVICIRDDRGRKVFGVYAQSDVTEHRYSNELGTVQIAVREVFHAET